MLTKEARALKSLSAPERVCLAFEELGPTFIKFGQVLSSRPDLLSTEFVKELSKLQDSVPPFPFGDAKSLIEAQFGRPLTEVFVSFEEEPLAAASLAQVHRARTNAGDEVAVKVQRPGIEEIIETDIRILFDLAALCERHLPESRYYEPVQIVDEFAKTIHGIKISELEQLQAAGIDRKTSRKKYSAKCKEMNAWLKAIRNQVKTKELKLLMLITEI